MAEDQQKTTEATDTDTTDAVDTQEEDASLLDKAKEAVADAAEAVSETVSEAAEAVKETAEEAVAAVTDTDDDAETADEAEEAVAETEAAEEDVEEETVAEAAATEDGTEPDAETSITEAAVEEAVQEIEVPSASEAGIDPTEAPDEKMAFEDRAAMEDAFEGVGYTGEIVGKVVKLEDLEDEPEEAEAEGYDQLMKLIEATLTDVSEQEIVKGRVVSVGEKEIVVDFGFKSDGVVSKNEFDHELEAGDEVEVFLERIEDYHGQPVISKTKADNVRRWQRVEDAFEGEKVLEGTIVRRIKGGMIVELFDGLEAFLPGSQVDVRPVRDFDAYLEKRMEFKIVKLNPANENIVVSHKALIEKELNAQREKILSTMEPGQILEGIVKNITDFGVFIDLGGVDGLLHITDLSWGRVSHPSELVDLDEKMNVVVLDYDKERQRISLGLKQLQPHPWENIGDRYTEGDTVEGKVVSITDYGAFVELEKGIEGLVHISEMSWTEHVRHPSQMVALGQIVPVKILNIDHEGKKISLGMKQLQPDPWEGLSDRYPPGTVMRGKVRNITSFGVFVEIEPGIDGLVHISDLSWTKKIRHPGEVVKKGQELDVVILNIDEKERRISLGHKQVETNPWNQFANVYAEGTDVEGDIARLSDGGVVVELPLGVEAFIPASELKNGPRDFEQFYHEGDHLGGLVVIRFDASQKEIIVSETAKDRAEERQARSEAERERRREREQERRDVATHRSTSTSDATSGPTTLGELSGLADLKAQMQEAEQAADAAAADEEAEPAEEATKAEAEPANAEVEEPVADEAEPAEDADTADAEAEAEVDEEGEAETLEAEAATADADTDEAELADDATSATGVTGEEPVAAVDSGESNAEVEDFVEAGEEADEALAEAADDEAEEEEAEKES